MKLERKLMVVGLVCLLVCMSIVSVWGTTRTITSDSDDIYTRIICSNGNTYEATFANLQTAVNSSGCTEVKVPACNITFTGTLWIPSNVSLIGVGNGTVFYLGNNVNRTLIRNIGGNTWITTSSSFGFNSNIKISNIRLDGNAANQPHYWRNSGGMTAVIGGIFFKGIKNCLIRDISIRNMDSFGISCSSGGNVTIENIDIKNIGLGFIGTGKNTWWSQGILLDGTNNSIISKIRIDNVYNIGITLESIDVTKSHNYLDSVIIEDFFINDCEIGIYGEHIKNCIIKDGIVKNATRYEVYGTPSGVYITHPSFNNKITDVHVDRCGNYSVAPYAGGAGFYISGRDTTVIGCTANKSRDGFVFYQRNMSMSNCKAYGCRNGTYISGYNISIDSCIFTNNKIRGIAATSLINKNPYGRISNCDISGSSSSGILSTMDNLSIIGCRINNASDGIEIRFCHNIISGNIIRVCSDDGIQINGYNPNAGNNATIMNNIIDGCTGNGVELGESAENCTVIGNIVHHCANGILENTGANWNIIIGNNCLLYGTQGIDLTGAKSIAIATGNIPTPV